ncbi:MAG: hypothetical protein ACREQY_16980 [Candidatus Binatia bacterium]
MFVRVAALVLTVVAVAACGGDGGGGCVFFGGSYNGSVSDNVFGGGTISASILQDGCGLSGSAEICFQQGCDSTQIAGSGDGRSFRLTLFQPGVACQVRANGTLSDNTVSGSYARQNCNTGGGGTFVASR